MFCAPLKDFCKLFVAVFRPSQFGFTFHSSRRDAHWDFFWLPKPVCRVY